MLGFASVHCKGICLGAGFASRRSGRKVVVGGVEEEGRQWCERPCTTRLWRQSTLLGCFEARRSDDCLEWAQRVMTAVDGGTFEEWCSLLWTLWKERNTQLFNGQKMPEEEIVTRASTYLATYRQQQGNEPIARTPQLLKRRRDGSAQEMGPSR
ncbi:unnamed protein product [Linum tenue]|uniref:Uncharacterized protein n=1 Tax=Linum tenue TaxID=586396 RepID=A0AAV0MSR3_9ROSI|nr:unnamed protein product [Linum tenue]